MTTTWAVRALAELFAVPDAPWATLLKSAYSDHLASVRRLFIDHGADQARMARACEAIANHLDE